MATQQKLAAWAEVKRAIEEAIQRTGEEHSKAWKDRTFRVVFQDAQIKVFRVHTTPIQHHFDYPVQ